MKLLLNGAILLLLMSCGLVFAADYSIGKVVEVGPGSPAIVGSFKWSPDGSAVAYFREGALYLADTLGVSRLAAKLDAPPLRYEWQSDDEILIHLKEYPAQLVDVNRLVRVNTKNQQVEEIEQFTRSLNPAFKSSATAFSGPWQTVEGRVFYRTNVMRTKDATVPEAISFPQIATAAKALVTKPEESHMLSWGADGLYLVRGNLAESTFLAPKPANYVPLPAVLSPDQSCYMFRGLLYWFADGRSIMLDKLIKDYPQGMTACDFLHYSFNPKSTEVLFTLIYFNDNDDETFRIATYDYVADKLTILDPLMNMTECEAPSYSPDGRKIAFHSQGKVYMLYREEL